MAFRVVIAGGRIRVDYARLRNALDKALAKRLPDVEIVTGGGPGIPALAASYTRSRNLPVTVIRANHEKHRADAENSQIEQLVALADAAVVVWEGNGGEVYRLLALLRARDVPVIVIGGQRPAGKPTEPAPPSPPRFRGLPD